MSVHRDIATVRAFLAKELSARQKASHARYLCAKDTADAFERLAAWVGEEDRKKQVREFQEIWPAPVGDDE